MRSIDLPRGTTFDHSQLLGDGTLYRLEFEPPRNVLVRVDPTAVLVRIDDVTAAPLEITRLPLRPPPGVVFRSESDGNLRWAVSSPGLSIDRNRRGSVWWEEDGPEGRFIEFRVDGDRASMVPLGAGLDDPKAPVAHRFNRTPDRELPYRLTTGAADVGPDVPRAYLGGRGFSLAVARIGREGTEGFVELPASDLPHVDVGQPAPGVLTLTVGYIVPRGPGGAKYADGGQATTYPDRGRAVQVTYDFNARTWRDHRPLADFPEAQGVEIADVGAAGVLAALGLPWNGAVHDPETGLYWIRPRQPVRHLLQRIRDLRTITLPDGFVALFEDDFRRDRTPADPKDMFVLRAQGDRLALSVSLPATGAVQLQSFRLVASEPFCRDLLQLPGGRIRVTRCSHPLIAYAFGGRGPAISCQRSTIPSSRAQRSM